MTVNAGGIMHHSLTALPLHFPLTADILIKYGGVRRWCTHDTSPLTISKMHVHRDLWRHGKLNITLSKYKTLTDIQTILISNG